jgi:hypothetical protein
MTLIHVESYSGYRRDQRPLRFRLGENLLEVEEIEDQWYSPEAMYFKVRANDRNIYILKHDESPDQWTLDGFRSGS